jgi:hypothetical protein
MIYLKPFICSLPVLLAFIMVSLPMPWSVFSYFLAAGFTWGVLHNARALVDEEFNLEDIGWCACWPIMWGRTLEQLIYNED